VVVVVARVVGTEEVVGEAVEAAEVDPGLVAAVVGEAPRRGELLQADRPSPTRPRVAAATASLEAT